MPSVARGLVQPVQWRSFVVRVVYHRERRGSLYNLLLLRWEDKLACSLSSSFSLCQERVCWELDAVALSVTVPE